MEAQEIILNTVELSVSGHWQGKHYPATMEQPEEFPEFIINKITTKDSEINLQDLLSEDQIEAIFTQINHR